MTKQQRGELRFRVTNGDNLTFGTRRRSTAYDPLADISGVAQSGAMDEARWDVRLKKVEGKTRAGQAGVIRLSGVF